MKEHSINPFPIQGGRVDDGSNIPNGGTVPQWLAELVYMRFVRLCAKSGIVDIPTMAMIARQGGFTPLAFIDLMAGGDGTGLAWNAIATGSQTILEEKLALVRPGQIIIPVTRVE